MWKMQLLKDILSNLLIDSNTNSCQVGHAEKGVFVLTMVRTVQWHNDLYNIARTSPFPL